MLLRRFYYFPFYVTLLHENDVKHRYDCYFLPSVVSTDDQLS